MGLANSGTILLKDENMPPPGEFFADFWKVFFISVRKENCYKTKINIFQQALSTGPYYKIGL